MILTEKQQNCQHYGLEKLINMSFLHAKKSSNQIQIIEHANFTYYLGGELWKNKQRNKLIL